MEAITGDYSPGDDHRFPGDFSKQNPTFPLNSISSIDRRSRTREGWLSRI